MDELQELKRRAGINEVHQSVVADLTADLPAMLERDFAKLVKFASEGDFESAMNFAENLKQTGVRAISRLKRARRESDQQANF